LGNKAKKRFRGEIDKQIVVSRAELAQTLNLTETRISQLNTRNIMVKVAKGKYDLLKSVRNYMEYRDSDDNDENNLTEARRLKIELDTKIAEIEYKKKIGEIIPREDAAREWGAVVRKIRAKLLSLPVKLAPEIELIQNKKEIREILSELAGTEFYKGN